MKDHILMVDDDQLLRRSLTFILEQAGLRTTAAATAEEALLSIQQDPPDLILLDIGLPGMDGLAALHHFRDVTAVPILFVTARRRELDEVLGLEAGADDYIAKPFDKDVLLARIRTALRRVQAAEPVITPTTVLLHVGDLVIDPKGFTATLQGHTLTLSVREFSLLYTLAQHTGEVLSLESLITQVWGADYEGEMQAVYIYIRALRSKLEAVAPLSTCRIVTVRGIGYKFVDEAG